jgi:hypothetical protein
MTIAGKKGPTIQTSVLLPEDLHTDSKEMADFIGMPFSAFIRQAMKEKVERERVLRRSKDEAA